MAEVDKACCSLPAVTTHDYKPKGTYTKLAGLDVCKSALSAHISHLSTNAILIPQTQQAHPTPPVPS